jgi:hypothetical protein
VRRPFEPTSIVREAREHLLVGTEDLDLDQRACAREIVQDVFEELDELDAGPGTAD